MIISKRAQFFSDISETRFLKRNLNTIAFFDSSHHIKICGHVISGSLAFGLRQGNTESRKNPTITNIFLSYGPVDSLNPHKINEIFSFNLFHCSCFWYDYVFTHSIAAPFDMLATHNPPLEDFWKWFKVIAVKCTQNSCAKINCFLKFSWNLFDLSNSPCHYNGIGC